MPRIDITEDSATELFLDLLVRDFLTLESTVASMQRDADSYYLTLQDFPPHRMSDLVDLKETCKSFRAIIDFYLTEEDFKLRKKKHETTNDIGSS